MNPYMDSTIRLLERTDYSAFLILINEFRPTHFSREQFEEIFDYQSTHSEIWVADQSGVLLGTGTVLYERKFIFNTCWLAHIEDVCVHSSYRRHGIGKRIIQALVDAAEARGCYKVTLDCAEHNVPFYVASGLELRGKQMTRLLHEPICEPK